MILQKRNETRKRWLVCLGLIIILTIIFAWPFYPVSIKRKIVSATSATKWAEYNRLTRLVALGMEAREVSQILGRPESVDHLSIGERWIYYEDGPTAVWTYIAEFKKEPKSSSLHLCYLVNMKNRVFPEGQIVEIGERLKTAEHEGTILFGYPPHSNNGQPKN